MPGDVIRLVVHGSVGSTQTWSFSVNCNLVAGGAPAQSVLDTWLTGGVRTGFNTWRDAATTGLKACIGTNALITGLTAYYSPAFGAPATVISTSTESTAGTGTPVQPPQIAVVATLLSANPGRANRGRMYIPVWTTTAQSNQRLGTTFQTAIATKCAAFLTAVNGTALGSDAVTCGPGRGTSITYSSVRVDDRFDTQRRRVDKFLGTSFQSAAI